jgi:hypothetical protein
LVYAKDPSLLDKHHNKFAIKIQAKRSVQHWVHHTYRQAKKEKKKMDKVPTGKI